MEINVDMRELQMTKKDLKNQGDKIKKCKRQADQIKNHDSVSFAFSNPC